MKDVPKPIRRNGRPNRFAKQARFRPKLNVGAPENPKTHPLDFITQPITGWVLTLAFVSAVFTGFLLSNALYSSIRTQNFTFNENTFIAASEERRENRSEARFSWRPSEDATTGLIPVILSHSFRVHEASVIKVKKVLTDAMYDYFYGFLP